jgi:hypothetical protein
VEIVFELIRDSGRLISAGLDWFAAQGLPLQILSAAAALAVLWVLWILVRVLMVALRAAFRGL